jgi:inner membrane protein
VPTIITHAAVGLALAVTLRSEKTDARWWTLAALLPVVPDADTPLFGAEDVSAFSHRGVTHSLVFAALLAAVAVCACYRRELSESKKRAAAIGAVLFLAMASHGLLDAFTDGGAGVMLAWPLQSTRTFWSARPIEVAPLSIHAFFSEWGWNVFQSELHWVWLPAAGVVVVAEIARRVRRRMRSAS